jgi:uncharacterized protein
VPIGTGLSQRQDFLNDYSKMAPQATPESKPYWDGLREGELMLQRNKKTLQAYFPPRPFDPRDPFAEVEWFQASGRGKLETYVISHRPPPGYEAPFSIAVVRLEEGPTMLTNIVDCPQTPEALQLDMALELAPHTVNDEVTLPLWRPAKGA